MVKYDLDSLGWYEFEHLSQALLRAIHGAALETWGGRGDWGRDAYCAQPLMYPDPKVLSKGPFVFQVKHVTAANAAGANPEPALMAAVSSEAREIRKRILNGRWAHPTCYSLMTNVDLSATMRTSVRERLKEVIPDAIILPIGATEFDAMLDGNPRIRESYPQILGIADLESLIQSAVSRSVRERSRFALEEAKDLSPVFVATNMYVRALGVLARYGFVVLTGPPEMGKTSIALMIALARFTNNWEIFDCRHPDQFFESHKADRKQLFIADDAFGQTEYRPELASEWSRDLRKILSATNKDHGLIWTSRPAPLREGLKRNDFQGRSRNFPEPGQVEVNVDRLSIEEKAQILYRHAKSANLNATALHLIRENAVLIVRHPHFTPLRIERFVSEQLPRIAGLPSQEREEAIEAAIEDGLQRPTHSMLTSFAALDDEHQSILFALLESGPRADSASVISAAERILGRPLRTYTTDIVEDIRDHFIRVREFPSPQIGLLKGV